MKTLLQAGPDGLACPAKLLDRRKVPVPPEKRFLIRPTQGPMKVRFHCNGGNNCFNPCYAGSPTVAGLLITSAQAAVMQCRVHYSRCVPDNTGAGFLNTAKGRNGAYIGNALFADKSAGGGKRRNRGALAEDLHRLERSAAHMSPFSMTVGVFQGLEETGLRLSNPWN